MIFGKHINRYYLKYAHFLLFGLVALVAVDYLQLEIPKLYRMVIDGMSYGYVAEGGAQLAFDMDFTAERVGYYDTEMVKEFFYAVSYSAGMNLHIKVLTPGNNHHMAEAMFKAFAKALDQATTKDERITTVLSTKGRLE